MKTEKAVILTILVCASLVLSFWLGYRSHPSPRVTPPPTGGEQGTKPKWVIVDPPPPTEANVDHLLKGPFTYEPRDPEAKPLQIDLTTFYNASLAHAWQGIYKSNNFRPLPTGLQFFDGTQFDVRGLIQLRGPFEGADRYPPRINGIPIGLHCQKLHFLHNACLPRQSNGSVRRSAAKGEQIGAYIIRYADGDTLTVPIRYNENITEWWASKNNMPRPSNAVVAWEGQNITVSAYNSKILLTKFTWENPRPDAEVKSLDFQAEGTSATPFLIAITAEE
jgi:hypothetical protein